MPPEVSEETGQEFETDEARMAWLETLPEPVREWQEATTAKSPQAFYDQMGHLRTQVGRSIVIPTEEASDDQRTEFYQKVVEQAGGKLAIIPGEGDEQAQAAWRRQQGIPDDVAGYEFPELPEGVPADFIGPDRAAALKALAHKHGLPADKFKAMAGDLIALDAQALTQAQEASAAAQGELKAEWGEAYDQRYQRVATFLERDGAPPELIAAAHGKTLGPKTATYLYSVLERMGGESGEVARQTGGASQDTAADAQQKIDEIMAQDGRDGRPKHPYFEGDRKALEQMVRLTKLANPGSREEMPGKAPLPEALTG